MGARAVWGSIAAVMIAASVWYAGADPSVSRGAEPAPLVPTAVPQTAVGLQRRFDTQIKPLLTKHCYSCHANGKHKGDLSLDPYTTLVSVQSARDKWLHISETLKQKLMPPEEKPQPTQAEFDLLIGWVNDALNFCDCSGPRDPGRVAIHRLNRTEYNNTVRDLLGVDVKPAKDFPADDTGYGFDNIADVLSMSPLLAEKYLSAAEQALDSLIPSDRTIQPRVKRYAETALKATGERNTAIQLVQAGEIFFTYDFAADGQYDIRVRGYERSVGNEDVKLSVRLDGREVGSLTLTGQRDKPVTVKARFASKLGAHKVAIFFTNPKAETNPATKKLSNRSANIDYIEIDGPYNAVAPPPPPGYRKVFIAKPGAGVTEEAAAKAILARFTTRAYRRPSATDEVDSLMKVFRAAKAEGETFEQSVKLALTAVLVSPQFLFRIEIDPPAALSATDPSKPVVYLVSDNEFVTRLSYFLWSSTPDDELLSLAASHRIREPATLEAQVKRMLLDPRSSALVENFAGQWLELRNLDDYRPDTKVYPTWDDALRTSMKRETEVFFENIMRQDRSILELLNSDYTFVNERLAKHYGLPEMKGEEFRRVSLAGTKRGGVLTQASVLTVTAMPTRTSPVKRGKFILENVLGTPPPPPPPDVPALSEQPKDTSKATLKVRLEEHRKDPNCAVCHIRMDAIGFTMENFDAVGQWRERDGAFPIDSTGKLPEGTVLKGADGLRQMLLGRQNDFVSTVTKKMLTYALGRGLEFYDQCSVKDIEAAMRLNQYKFSSLILAIVKSEPFQKRRMLRPDEIRLKAEAADKPEKKESKS
jgi:hypothetical protein